jgi:hypothetical protein
VVLGRCAWGVLAGTRARRVAWRRVYCAGAVLHALTTTCALIRVREGVRAVRADAAMRGLRRRV